MLPPCRLTSSSPTFRRNVMHGVTSQKKLRHYRCEKLTVSYVFSEGFKPTLLRVYRFDISALHAMWPSILFHINELALNPDTFLSLFLTTFSTCQIIRQGMSGGFRNSEFRMMYVHESSVARFRHYPGSYLKGLRKTSQTNIACFWVDIWTRDFPIAKEESCRCGLPAVNVHYVTLLEADNESAKREMFCVPARQHDGWHILILSVWFGADRGGWGGGGRTSDCSQFLVYRACTGMLFIFFFVSSSILPFTYFPRSSCHGSDF